MKKTIPFLLLAICALGCGKSGPQTSSSSNSANANTNSAPTTIAKVVDLPAAIGKTGDEIKKMISGTPTHEDPWLEYSLKEANLTFKFDKAKKADEAIFSFKPVTFGNAMISGFDTPEELATMAGVDIKGKTPKSKGDLADTYEFDINGKKADVSFYKLANRYNGVTIDVQ